MPCTPHRLSFTRRAAHLYIMFAVVETYRVTPLTRARASAPRMVALADDDIARALADEKYAMDISSITEGSEKETYIGQGSGVNAGTGIGALAGWVKGLVGRYLCWKNRPVYESLWQIIEDDLLAMVKEHEPALKQCRTWFSEPGANPAAHTFATADGKCEGTVAGYKGAKIDWITTCKFFSSELGFGNLRIDGWASRETRAPHVAVHLCIVFNVLFIYIGMPPRTNLILDDAYNDHVYGSPRACTGKSLNDYHVECVEDKAFKQYTSKSHVVNAFMVAPTTLLYTIRFSKKNFARVRQLSIDYVRSWLELLDETDGVLLEGIETREVQTELLQLDVRTRQFCGRDPDTKNVANIFGLETTDKLVRTLWGNPDDTIWQSR
eukprot:CAMPEP_0119315654 /NCGR_PEP_ID=MMETSP1333-20130426/36701_1 /TAXON_ID=418940 /ORGANISM="Scyphosphaera apsteinii, Strain RCC1455" /LENGTH=379 /DNA_ID=CAMNT_0007321087 /DNA_START=11 /DNA_END=1150 /DNA_ORIENTATION=-